MNRSFLSSFAASYFATRPSAPLLVALAAQLNGMDPKFGLISGCRPLQHLAWQRIVNLPEVQLSEWILKSLNPNVTEVTAVTLLVLKALTHDSIPITESILTRVVSLIESTCPEVRLAAATVIALRQPTAALPWLQQRDSIERNVLRRFCLADDPTMIVPLMHAFGFPLKFPTPTIGFLVTAQWLGEHHAEEPKLVEWLARNCGYCDEDLSPEALNLLSSGFSYVTTRMTNEPRLLKVAHRWQRRIRAFVWRLLPDELELQRDDDKPFDVNVPLDVDLFLAAVRDSDRLAFFEQKSRPPFSRLATRDEPAPVCFHASSRYFRRTFLDEPLARADQWNIPQARQGDFLIEWARVLLEPNEETRLAGDLALRGRWRPATNRSDRLIGVQGSAHQLASSGMAHDDRLSPGANSVVALAAACGLNRKSIADWLQEAESRWSRFLLPIGIEVQIPRVDPDDYTRWKKVLPQLGVPSPIRPEFGGMVEAAFRPAFSFHAMVLGPLLLCRLGIINEPQDLALHISLQGELGNRVRSIAFPHHFIHPSNRLRNRSDRSMARVMSKGLVHLHDDAETLDPLKPPGRRTELRLFRIFAETPLELTIPNSLEQSPTSSVATEVTSLPKPSMRLSQTFIGDIISVQILGSALLSNCQMCRELFEGFEAAMEQATHELPEEFQQLLAANYFESTGDPYDDQLLELLPIFRCWSKVRKSVHTNDLAARLDLQFRILRNLHVQKLIEHWADDHDLASPEISFRDNTVQLDFPWDE